MKQKSPWFVRLGEAPAARCRLLCFPYAGGGGGVFAEWRRYLPPDIDLYALQLPGRGVRFSEPAIASFDPLVAALDEALNFDDGLPCYFFGHSLGGLMAFELARRCAGNSARRLSGLIVSGCGAPSNRRSVGNMHTLDDAALRQKLCEYNGTPPEVLAHRELMELLLPMIRADFALFEDYVYRSGPRLDTPFAVFSGSGDEFMSQACLEGWKAESSASCELFRFDGNHFFINSRRVEVVEQVVAVVRDWDRTAAARMSDERRAAIG